MKNLIQKICLGILLTSSNAILWASNEIQGSEHEKPPLRIINGELEDGLGESFYDDNFKSAATTTDVVLEARKIVKKRSTKSERRKSRTAVKKSERGMSGSSKKEGINTTTASLDLMIQGLIPKEMLMKGKPNFKAPSELDLVDLVFILCAGEKEVSNKPKKVYLPFHAMAAGFKGMDEGNIQDLRRDTMLNCEALMREQDFIKVRNKLVMTKRSELERFTFDFIKKITSDYLAFAKSANTKARNIRARRILDEVRAADTMGGDLKANFGVYEIFLDNNRLPGYKMRLSFAAEPGAYKLSKDEQTYN